MTIATKHLVGSPALEGEGASLHLEASPGTLGCGTSGNRAEFRGVTSDQDSPGSEPFGAPSSQVRAERVVPTVAVRIAPGLLRERAGLAHAILRDIIQDSYQWPGGPVGGRVVPARDFEGFEVDVLGPGLSPALRAEIQFRATRVVDGLVYAEVSR